MSTYSISNDDYNWMLTVQKGVCAICLKNPDNKRLAVDHNHDTNEIRGLLCIKCNSALGKFKDNIELIKRAALYLELSK
jgi:hypothetical protein